MSMKSPKNIFCYFFVDMLRNVKTNFLKSSKSFALIAFRLAYVLLYGYEKFVFLDRMS